MAANVAECRNVSLAAAAAALKDQRKMDELICFMTPSTRRGRRFREIRAADVLDRRWRR
jgi:hypothetical protein